MKLFVRQWQVAYRKTEKGNILEDKSTPFTAIPNTCRYTAADPFLFSYKGVKYLFAEILDKKTNLGNLGYAVFDGNRFSPWKIVISEPYHLSYPNIFEYNGNIYIVPEANESNSIYAYKAIDFPDKWEKCPAILFNVKCVDTTFLSKDEKNLLFTYDISNEKEKKLVVYSVNLNGKAESYYSAPVSANDASARPGGNFFDYNGDTIRVSQDCNGDYGKALVFSKVLQCDKNGYREEIIQHIAPADIKINCREVSGIHTYNTDNELEVIDMHVPDRHLYTQFRRITKKLR